LSSKKKKNITAITCNTLNYQVDNLYRRQYCRLYG